MPRSGRSVRTAACSRRCWTRRRCTTRGLPVVADIVPNETGGTTMTELTYDRLILGSVVLGRKLAALTRPGEHVGVHAAERGRRRR